MGSPDEAYNNPVESMNFIRATLEADGDGYALRIATPDEADLLLPWPTARHTAELVERSAYRKRLSTKVAERK